LYSGFYAISMPNIRMQMYPKLKDLPHPITHTFHRQLEDFPVKPHDSWSLKFKCQHGKGG
jgi:hypothetical protein